MPDPARPLIDVLLDLRFLLTLPGNNFDWSSWEDADDALREIDGYIERLKADPAAPVEGLYVLFLPTGPLQEVSLSSGWGDAFIRVADQFDAAIAARRGPQR